MSWTLIGASIKSDILGICRGEEAFCSAGAGLAPIGATSREVGGLLFFMDSFDKVLLSCGWGAIVGGWKEACACEGGAELGKAAKGSRAGMSKALAA